MDLLFLIQKTTKIDRILIQIKINSAIYLNLNLIDLVETMILSLKCTYNILFYH